MVESILINDTENHIRGDNLMGNNEVKIYYLYQCKNEDKKKILTKSFSAWVGESGGGWMGCAKLRSSQD